MRARGGVDTIRLSLYTEEEEEEEEEEEDEEEGGGGGGRDWDRI